MGTLMMNLPRSAASKTEALKDSRIVLERVLDGNNF
jgi:hypothetical protein